MGQSEGQFPQPDPAVPSTARIYNYLIGGGIHYPADPAAAGRILPGPAVTRLAVTRGRGRPAPQQPPLPGA